MARITIKIKLQSTISPYFKTTTKNPRNKPEKMKIRKYDPVARKYAIFEEKKVK